MNRSSTRLSDTQRRLLAGIGVEVWIPRTRGDANALNPPARSEQRLDASPDTARRADTPLATQPVNLTLDAMSGAGAIVIGHFADPLDRRLGQDVLLALIGMQGEVQRAQFRWPQTQTGDSSMAAARNAYHGFLRGQVERARAGWVLLFGATAAMLIDAEPAIGEARILRLPEARSLRADPDAKKRLWLSVSQRQPV